MQPARGSLEVFLDHVTCIHTAPMLHMNDGDERKGGTRRTLPRISIRSEASVYAGVGPNSRLLKSEGNSYLEDIESLVSWIGFTNLYDGQSVFWELETSALDYSSRRLDFVQWNQFWQNRADSEDTNSAVLPELIGRNPAWRDFGNRMLLPSITPSVFDLDVTLFIPGPNSLPRARDTLIPGVNAQDLPPFPRSILAPIREPSSSVGASPGSANPIAPASEVRSSPSLPVSDLP